MGFKNIIGSAWNGIKSGVGSAGQYLNKGWGGIKSGIGTTAKWIGNNKEVLSNVGGQALSAIGAVTANPALLGAGAALTGYSNSLQKKLPDGEVKDALMKNIDDRTPGTPGYNKNIAYSNIPRIYYSAMPRGNTMFRQRKRG